MKCVPGESQDAHKSRVKLLLNLEKQIKAEKEGKPFSVTVRTPIKADIIEQAAITATEDMEAEAAEDRAAKDVPNIRFVES